MVTAYSARIDTTAELPTVIDGITPFNGDTVNRLRDAIFAIERELGVQPSSIYTTVRNRLDSIEGIISSLTQGGTVLPLGGDLSGFSTSAVVLKIHGAAVPSLFGAEPGNVLQVLNFTTLQYAPINLSGGINYVAGILPGTNVALATTSVQGALSSADKIKIDSIGAGTLQLDGSGGVVPGNLVGTANSGSLIKKLVGPGTSIGVATTTTSANGIPGVQSYGLVLAANTGLAAANPGSVIRNPATGNLVRSNAVGAGDDYLGEADSIGNVELRPSRVDKAVVTVFARKYMKTNDPSFDNGPALNLAFAEAAAACATLSFVGTGGNVIVDAGDYYFQTPATLGSAFGHNGMHLIGETQAGASGHSLSTRFIYNGPLVLPDGITDNGTVPGRSGSAATITVTGTFGVDRVVTVTGLTGMSTADVGYPLHFPSGGSHAVNRMPWTIATYISPTSVTINARDAVNDSGLHWVRTHSRILGAFGAAFVIEHITFGADAASVLYTAIEATQGANSGSSICSSQHYRFIRVSHTDGGASGDVLCGIVIGDSTLTPGSGQPADCENFSYQDCVIDTLYSGVLNPNSSGQTKKHVFYRCDFGFGGQYAINWGSGSFHTHECEMGGHLICELRIGILETCTINNSDSEHATCLLQCIAPNTGAGVMVSIQGGRYACDNVTAGIPYISFGGGTLRMEGISFTDLFTNDFKIVLSSASHYSSVVAIGCGFPNLSPFALSPMPDIDGDVLNAYFVKTQLGCYGMNDPSATAIILPNEESAPYGTGVDLNGIIGTSLGPKGFVASPSYAFAAATGANNDVAIQGASFVVVSASGDFTIGGIVPYGQLDGHELEIYNGSVHTMTLSNEGGSSTAANRFSTPTGSDLIVVSKGSIQARYVHALSRWIVSSTISGGGGGGSGVTNVTTNYTVLLSDFTISVGTLSGAINITLPASPLTGMPLKIKDTNGSALLHNISILGNGHNIDGVSPYVLNQNYESIDLIYSGSTWMVM